MSNQQINEEPSDILLEPKPATPRRPLTKLSPIAPPKSRQVPSGSDTQPKNILKRSAEQVPSSDTQVSNLKTTNTSDISRRTKANSVLLAEQEELEAKL